MTGEILVTDGGAGQAEFKICAPFSDGKTNRNYVLVDLSNYIYIYIYIIHQEINSSLKRNDNVSTTGSEWPKYKSSLKGKQTETDVASNQSNGIVRDVNLILN